VERCHERDVQCWKKVKRFLVHASAFYSLLATNAIQHIHIHIHMHVCTCVSIYVAAGWSNEHPVKLQLATCIACSLLLPGWTSLSTGGGCCRTVQRSTYGGLRVVQFDAPRQPLLSLEAQLRDDELVELLLHREFPKQSATSISSRVSPKRVLLLVPKLLFGVVVVFNVSY
jgi:hypothetical protein